MTSANMSLTKILFSLYRRFIFLFEPEKAHYLSLTIAELLYKSWLKSNSNVKHSKALNVSNEENAYTKEPIMSLVN